ncbi:MAG TPA: glycosyltransferase [Flavobacterium sp.]|uniref:glycosyltransferase n=1 Tax=Flavobacterium sp. TaxID=239 RepID=UPI002ED175EC
MPQENLFILFSDFGLGGVQRKIVDIANYISISKKYENITTHVILKHKSEVSFEKYLIKEKRVVVHYQIRLPIFRRLEIFFQNLEFLFLYLKYHPKNTFVFFHYNLPQLLLAKMFFYRQLNIIVGQDNILSLYNKPPHITRCFPNFFISFLFSLSSLVITQTSFAKNDLMENYFLSPNKILVIPNWAVDAGGMSGRKEIELIYCGRFAPQKRMDRMLKVFYGVKKVLPKAKLVLVGQGSEEKKIKKMIKEMELTKNVVLKPTTFFLNEELTRASLFILTSDFEGQPMVLLEAMLLKVVPVILNYPAANEYIIKGYDGFIEDTINDLTKRIIFLLSHQKIRKKIGENARDTVLKKYNKERIEQTIKAIRSSSD